MTEDKPPIVGLGILHFAQAWDSCIWRILFLGLLVRLFAISICTVGAQTQNATWLLTPGSGDFNTAGNWSPPTVPTGTATFGASNTTTITFSTNTSVGTLQFNAGAPAYTFNLATTSQTLTIINGVGIVNNSSNVPTLNAANGGIITFSGGFTNNSAGNANITTSNGGTVRFDTVTVGGNEFQGVTTAGTATITTNTGGVTEFSGLGTTASHATILTNGGTTEFLGQSTANNATITTNNGGRTEFLDASTGGNATFITNAGGIFDISRLTSNVMTAGSIQGAGIYFLGSNALTVGQSNVNTEVTGTIADGGLGAGVGGMLIKDGVGTLTLTGSNTYTGGTTISAGTLQIGNGGTTGSVVGNVTNNSVLAFDRSDAVTFGGVISGTGIVQDLGGGTLTLTGSNTYSGGTALDNGTLIAAETNALGTGPVTVNDATLLQINPGVTITDSMAINNGGSLINGGTIQVSVAPGGPVAAVTTSGGATITNQSGGMITGLGLIAIQSTSGTATITNSGVIAGTEGIALANGGIITNNAGGTISGNNGIAIASSGGSTNLSNAGVINGNVTLGNGANTVQLFSGGRISGSLDLGASAGSNLILDGSSDQTYSQAVTGATINAGSLTKQGTGDWLIDVAMNAPVSTNVLAGVLTVDGSLTSPSITIQTGGMLKGSGVLIGNVLNGGTLAPGNSPGTLTINGNFIQGPTGIYNVQIASAQNYSRLVVTGSASLNGTLRLTLASGYQPAPGQSFTVLTAAKGISGTFHTISSNTPVNVTYSNGVVDVSATPGAPKPQIHLSDGTPVSTTALIADYTFYGFGSLAERSALGLVDEESAKANAISLTFDAGEFDVQGHHGQTYTIPIAGGFRINDRARLDYEIPLQYITLDGTGLMQAGLTLDLPFKAILPSASQQWSWDVTPTVAFASSGSREIIGGGALSNVLAYRWRGITITYGNYISFFEGDVLTQNDPKFPTGVNQQIMKNGLRLDIPVAKSWLIDLYGIQTQFFQSATVSSYVTLGAELGHHFFWTVEDQQLDLGYLSFGFYTEFGNHYSSGHFRVGSAWRF